jgi:peroxiredoxin
MTMATIADQVAAMSGAMVAQPPNELMAIFAREQSELAARGVPNGTVPVGSLLPDVDLVDAHGATTTLYAATRERPAVVVFYRGAWCPYCNITLSHYQARLHAALVERGIELIAISPQTPDGSLTMQEKNELAFTVLSDPGNTLARHLGILTAPSPEVRAAQLQLGLDLISVNADGSTALPMPTTIILGAGHILQWIDVHPDYTTRSEADDIVAALEAAGL